MFLFRQDLGRSLVGGKKILKILYNKLCESDILSKVSNILRRPFRLMATFHLPRYLVNDVILSFFAAMVRRDKIEISDDELLSLI